MVYGNILFSAPVVMELISSATAAVSTVSGVDTTSSATTYQAPAGGLALFLDRIEYGILVPMVYFAVLFCLAGIVYRIVSIFRAPAQPFSIKIFTSSKKPGLSALADTFTMPQIRKHKPVFWVFLMIFHISFLLLILGHLDILPQISIIPEASRHMLGAGLVGVGVTLPLFYFLFRRFASPNREITVPADYILLILIIFLALFGDLMSWGNSWTASGFVMTKADFAKYFDGLLRFTFDSPRAVLPGSHYHFVVIHVLLANLFFILLPFSKVVHAFFAMPINLLRRK